MKPRSDVARFANEQFEDKRQTKRSKRGREHRWHYGKQELRDLLDYIYESTPSEFSEEISEGMLDTAKLLARREQRRRKRERGDS